MDQPFVTYDNPLVNENRRWRDVHRDQSEERPKDGRRNGDRRDDMTCNNTNRGNHVANNGYGSDQNNRHNRGNNDNDGSGNGGDRNNNNGNEVDVVEQHVVNVKNIIEEFEIPHEDVFMKLFIQSLTEDARECFYLSAFDKKIHYEILSNRPDTLQQAFKTTANIENNSKVAGKVAKRDDPKLHNPKNPKKDDLTQIMDILKDLKGKKNPNERPPYRNNKQMNYNRPRLRDMPYNTNWKDGKPVKPNTNKETPDPLKKVTNFVEEYPWCDVCNLPHATEQCMIAQGLIEKENENEDYEPTMNALSSEPYWGRNDDLSKEEEYSDVHQKRENLQYSIQQVFFDDDEDIPALRKLFQEEAVPSLRNQTEEENKTFIVAAIEQVKRNYQLRNRNVNNEKGKPEGIFAKVTKSDGTKNNVAMSKDAGAKKETELEKNKTIEMPKLLKPVEKK
ncbi:uncharacterized protein LOC131875828 [Cryptomeria japonica]|uniref:uncharacterized protein LOC131875828 n=1 Tax=Cryptomeria japonica TaxID=3369 RepID=UPI0027DA956B|nr:uncharacterized protein LOC131875828 [Cryptomeria japonica]